MVLSLSTARNLQRHLRKNELLEHSSAPAFRRPIRDRSPDLHVWHGPRYVGRENARTALGDRRTPKRNSDAQSSAQSGVVSVYKCPLTIPHLTM